MNVCVFCNVYHPRTSGVATVIDTIAIGLVETVRFTICPAFANPQPSPLGHGAQLRGSPELKLFSKVLAPLFGAYLPLTTACISGGHGLADYDLLHCHTLWPNSVFPLLRHVHRIPCVLTPHNGVAFLRLHGWGRPYQALARRALLAATRVVALSPAEEREILAFAPGARTTIIPNGIDIPVEGEARPMPEDGAPVHILFVGTVSVKKGVRELMEAARRIEAERPGATVFTFVGRVEEEFRGDPPANVQLAGFRSPEELPTFYRQADLLALPSYTEGMPMVILEAMAQGLPVVATPVGGIPCLVEDGVTGFLVPTGDAVTLAQRIMALVGDPALTCKMGQASRRRYAAQFTGTAMSGRYLDLYRSLARHRNV